MKLKSTFNKNTCKILILNALMFLSLSLPAQKPFERKLPSTVKTSLNAYSFNEMLSNHIKGKPNGMTLFELLDFTAQNNFDAIDITGYFFPSYPQVPTDQEINDVKRRAFELGLDIS